MNFQNNLLIMNDAFKSKIIKSSDRLRKKPFWVNTHEINQQYIDQQYLLENGEVYYASLVQANVAIFKPGTNNYGAVIIIGKDKLFYSYPLVLRKIASNLFEYKKSTNAPSNISNFVDIITDERKYVFNLPIPKDVSFGYEALFTTLIIDRHHLPKRKLVSGLFPVIAAPNKVKTCMVLPRRFWTEEMTKFFLGKIKIVPLSPFSEY